MAKFTQLFKEIQDNSITPIKTTFCGNLSSLETTAKDNLVNAINELKNSSGGASSGGIELLWSGSALLVDYTYNTYIPNMNTYSKLLLEYQPNGYGVINGNFISILLKGLDKNNLSAITPIFIPNITNQGKKSIYFKYISLNIRDNKIDTGNSGYILEFDGSGSYTQIKNPNGYYKIVNIYGIK